MDLAAKDICHCPRPKRSGRVYYSTEACLLCGLLITTRAMRTVLDMEAEEADREAQQRVRPRNWADKQGEKHNHEHRDAERRNGAT